MCSAEMMGCDHCNYHGSCVEHIEDDSEEILCDCFQWYAGENCQYNLKGKLFNLRTRYVCTNRRCQCILQKISLSLNSVAGWSDYIGWYTVRTSIGMHYFDLLEA